MQVKQRFTIVSGAMPVILLAAIFQGWALYALHRSIDWQQWPATDSAWLLAFYSVAVFAPLTVQLLSEHIRNRRLWIVVGAVAVAYFYFGYHYGSNVYQGTPKELFDSEDLFPAAFIQGLLWLLLMPFALVYLGEGNFRYASLFTTAWRNKLLLAEAVAFTGLFWLLLLLWQELFKMLGITFFTELFKEPLFIYPVTTLVFGIALHLIGSVERLTSAILEQVLSVLKWLAIVAGVILTLFTVALIFKLPGLVFEGQKAIGAAWLLWLVAVIVLLINAAYRDGTVEQPYPRWMAFALRCVIPLTVVIAATALYALMVRARHYGITVERVWAFIVAGTALAYSIGYSIAAFGKGKWLDGIGRVNVGVAVALIGIIALTLTPLLSPYRLAANSQYRAVLTASAISQSSDQSSSFRYLRFQAGRYGGERLNELSALQNHPEAARIRTTSMKMLQLQKRWEQFSVDLDAALSALVIFPNNREIDGKLRQQLVGTIEQRSLGSRSDAEDNPDLGGIFIDLNADSTDEFVLLHQNGGDVYERTGDDWKPLGRFSSNRTKSQDLKAQLESVAKGDVSAKAPKWNDLKIGDKEYSLGTLN